MYCIIKVFADVQFWQHVQTIYWGKQTHHIRYIFNDNGPLCAKAKNCCPKFQSCTLNNIANRILNNDICTSFFSLLLYWLKISSSKIRSTNHKFLYQSDLSCADVEYIFSTSVKVLWNICFNFSMIGYSSRLKFLTRKYAQRDFPINSWFLISAVFWAYSTLTPIGGHFGTF